MGTCSAQLPGGLGHLAPVVASREGGILREQAIGFLSHGGSRVAYAVTGSGPLLLLDTGRAHHLEAFWRHAPYRELVERLARRFTVVRWDRPGFGLSDRHASDLSAEGELALVNRLVRYLEADSVAVLAADDAGPTMIRFAARRPGLVSRMALFGTAADGRLLQRPELSPAVLTALANAAAPAIHGVVAAAQAMGCEPEVGAWLATALEASAEVPTMVEVVAGRGAWDATLDAALIRVPTLVLHRVGDVVLEPRWGRALAAGIRGAEFVPLAGSSHLLYAGGTDAVLSAVVPFLSGVEDEPAPLSRRELEVAQLVTLGLTNAEIGRRLAIRRRTVDAHLEHIRAKLSVGSRALIAAWVVRNQLAGAAQDGA